MEADFTIWKPTNVKMMQRKDIPPGVVFVESKDPTIRDLGVVLVFASVHAQEVKRVQVIQIAD